MRAISSYLVAILLALTPAIEAARKPSNSVLLSQVKSLTLRDGKQTSHRRVSAMPQLTCVGGSAQGYYNVDTMRCKNSGAEYDTEDIQWTCQASLPPEFKLGSTDVVCEGYDSPDDPYILKGSCGVEYRLILTELGEEKYGKSAYDRTYRKMTGGSKGGSILSSLFNLLFWAVSIGVALIFIYRIFNPVAGPRGNAPRRNQGGWGGGGGGGGDNGHDDAPPPYTPRASKSASAHRANQSHGSASNAGGWRPGFWSGTAAGAAAGYAFGNRGNRAGQQYGYDAQPGPSSWFGGNRNQRTFGGGSGFGGAGPSSFGGGGGSSAPSPSSSRQESTGFGGTRRR